ncbi:MAG TPA: hypothetical protein VFJ17_08985, partial [Mycobacteriales bacterium]|nr:hypothetical protein [Mycobacteriales bacterium]
GFLFLVFGVCTLLATFAQINPVWLYGPYNPSQVSAGSQPDWYIFFLDGSIRLMPNFETNLWGHTISWNLLVPGLVVPGLIFGAIALYPSLEAWFTKDRGYHNVLQRPRDTPVRTGLGVAAITFYLVLYLAAQNDVLATTFHLSINAMIWTLRIALLVAPPIAFYFVRRWAMGLRRHDVEVLEHGVETGIIRRLPSGGYVEVSRPLDAPARELLAAQVGRPELAAMPNGHSALAVGAAQEGSR